MNTFCFLELSLLTLKLSAHLFIVGFSASHSECFSRSHPHWLCLLTINDLPGLTHSHSFYHHIGYLNLCLDFLISLIELEVNSLLFMIAVS